jgi:hypothetical protein
VDADKPHKENVDFSPQWDSDLNTAKRTSHIHSHKYHASMLFPDVSSASLEFIQLIHENMCLGIIFFSETAFRNFSFTSKLGFCRMNFQ